MNIHHHKILRDYVSRHDRLNPRNTTPRDDRISDAWAWAWRIAVAFGLCVLAVDMWIKLLSGDLI